LEHVGQSSCGFQNFTEFVFRERTG
jgi:hypothetical protein